MSDFSPREKAFFAPLMVFMGVMWLSQMVSGIFDGRAFWVFSKAQYWMHPVQVLVCGVMLIRWWHFYEWRPPQRVFFTVFIGVLTLVLWVSPIAYLVEHFFPKQARTPGFDPAFFGADGLPYYLNLGTRFVRMVIIVPLVEEIFWRGFLLRWLIDENPTKISWRPFRWKFFIVEVLWHRILLHWPTNGDFTKVPIGTFQWRSFIVVTLFFMLEHTPPDWPAALLTGALFNWVAIHTRSLSSCVLVHAITNLGLGLYVLQTGKTGFW